MRRMKKFKPDKGLYKFMLELIDSRKTMRKWNELVKRTKEREK